MKRPLALLLLLCCLLTGLAAGEGEPKPDAYTIAEQALPILSALMMCPSAASFEEAPEGALTQEAIIALRQSEEACAELSDEALYRAIFASGEYIPAEGDAPALLPVKVEIDSAIDYANGQIKVSLTVYADGGEDLEFYCLVDIFLLPDAEAPFGSRINRVFFPE